MTLNHIYTSILILIHLEFMNLFTEIVCICAHSYVFLKRNTIDYVFAVADEIYKKTTMKYVTHITEYDIDKVIALTLFDFRYIHLFSAFILKFILRDEKQYERYMNPDIIEKLFSVTKEGCIYKIVFGDGNYIYLTKPGIEKMMGMGKISDTRHEVTLPQTTRCEESSDLGEIQPIQIDQSKEFKSDNNAIKKGLNEFTTSHRKENPYVYVQLGNISLDNFVKGIVGRVIDEKSVSVKDVISMFCAEEKKLYFNRNRIEQILTNIFQNGIILQCCDQDFNEYTLVDKDIVF